MRFDCIVLLLFSVCVCEDVLLLYLIINSLGLSFINQ